MRSRAMLSLKSFATVPLLGVASVHAASEGQEESAKTVKVRELPLYGEPAAPKLIYIDEEATQFRQYVSTGRKMVWLYLDSMKETTDKIQDGYASLKKYADESLASVREDTAVLQRAALITVAGLGGVVAGYKGGYIRKAFFASTAMVATASLVYPRQAVDITSRNWEKVKSEAMDMYKQKTVISPSKATKSVESEVKDKVLTIENTASTIDTYKEDHGQSKHEDKDMYSTRD